MVFAVCVLIANAIELIYHFDIFHMALIVFLSSLFIPVYEHVKNDGKKEIEKMWLVYMLFMSAIYIVFLFI